MRSICTSFSFVNTLTAFCGAFTRIHGWAINRIFPAVSCTSSGMSVTIIFEALNIFFCTIKRFTAVTVWGLGIPAGAIENTFTRNALVVCEFDIAWSSNFTAVFNIISNANTVCIWMLPYITGIAQCFYSTDIFYAACRCTASVIFTIDGGFAERVIADQIFGITGLGALAAQRSIAKTICFCAITIL
jgi:hypothetical protein